MAGFVFLPPDLIHPPSTRQHTDQHVLETSPASSSGAAFVLTGPTASGSISETAYIIFGLLGLVLISVILLCTRHIYRKMKNRTPLPDSIFEIQRGAIMIQRNEKHNSIDRIHDIERNTLARRSIIHAEIGGGGYDLKADLDVVVVAESAEASAGKDRFCAACVEPIEIARTRSDKPPLAELKRYESRLVRAYSLDANALEKRRRDMMARQQSKRNVQNAAVRCNTTSLSSGILADIESVGMDNALEAGDFSFDVGAGDDSSSVASCEMMVPFQTGWILSEYETQAHIPHSSAVVELE